MHARNRIARIGAAVILLGHAPGLYGQSQTGPLMETPREAGWVFTPTLGIGGGWDDNVLLANPGDDPPKDYLAPVNPGVSLDFTGRRTRFSSGYLGAFTFYRTVDELSSYEHHASIRFQHRLTKRLTIVAEDTFAHAPTTDALQLAGIPFYRVGSQTNTAGGGLDAALDKYTTVIGRYTLRTVSFDFDEVSRRQLRGGNSHEVDLAVNRAISPRLTIGADYSLDRGSVNQQLIIDGGEPLLPDQQFNIQTVGATSTFRVHPALTLNGGVGIARIAGTVTRESRIGPAVEAGASWQGKYHVANVSYQRSFIPSFGFGGTFQNEEWVASVRVPFARNRAYTDTSLSWLTNEPLTLDQPDLQWLYVSSRVGYRVTPWLSLEGYYTRSQQDAQIAGSQLTRNQVGFQVVTSKPMKLR